MSANGILPAIGVRRSAVPRSIHPVTSAKRTESVTDKVSSRSRIVRGLLAGASYLCVALTIFISVAAFAQSDVGTIVGFVKDQSGAVVPKAIVTVRNEATGELHTVSSDDQGHYTAPSLPPAYYSMTAEAKGFERYTSTHNKLESNSTISIDADLAVGAATQTIEVTGTASVLQTQSGAVQSEISGQQIQTRS